MKKIFSILFLVIFAFTESSGQSYSGLGTTYGSFLKRFRPDSTLHIPTFSGLPSGVGSLKSSQRDRGAFYYDSAAKKTYVFHPKDTTWSEVGRTTIPWDSVTSKPTFFRTKYDSSTDIRDSILARLPLRDTSNMLAPYLRKYDTTAFASSFIRTFGNQSGITGNKVFTNDLTANSFIKSSGTSDQLLQGDGGVQSKSDIHSGAFTFDTTGRLLTIPVLGGGSYSVLIPRGTASGAEGITALTSSRTGNLVTVFGDNGSSTTFSARDADSANAMLYTDTASMLSNYRRTSTRIESSDLRFSTISGVSLGASLFGLSTGYGLNGSGYDGGAIRTWEVDTGAISTKANVTGLLVGYATVGSVSGKLNISDTTAMLANLLRKTDTATMLLPFMQYSDTANMLSPYARTSNLPDFSAKVNVSDTASMLSNYRRKTTLIENSDLRNSAITINGSSTSLGGTINVGSVTSVGLTAPTGFTVSNSPITSSGNIGLAFTAGYSLPTTASQALWDIAYNKRVTSANLSTSQLTLTLGDASTVTASVPTFNQNTTGTAASLSAVLASTLGGAGSVSGILKANGSGVVSAAVAGTDYVAPSALSGYVDLTSAQTVGGTKTFTGTIVGEGNGLFKLGAASVLNVGADQTMYGGSNSDGGVFVYGANKLHLSTNSSRRLTIDGSGNVTVNGGSFTVGSTSGTGTGALFAGAGTFTGALSGTSLSMSGGGSFLGNVGIGTASPVARLQVTKTREAPGTTGNAATAFLRLANPNEGGTGLDMGVMVSPAVGAWLQARDINDYSSNTNLFLNQNGGDVLIGTTTTDGTNKLIVNGGVKGTTGKFGSAGANATLEVAASSGEVFRADAASGAARIIANQTGVTLGGTLDALGAATFSSSVTAGGRVYTNNHFRSDNDANNYVLYGFGSASYGGVSAISSTEWALGYSNSPTTLITTALKWNTSGAITASSSVTATGFIVSSDIRYKNLISQDGDLYTFTLKADETNQIHYGYIAQEVEKTLPEVVSTNTEGYKAVNYIEVHAIKIRELEKQIEELKKLIKK